MLQPDIKFSGWPITCLSPEMQIANHFNIAKHYAQKAMGLAGIGKKKEDIDFDELQRALMNIINSLHNLGQTLVTVEQYDYDLEHAKPDEWFGYGEFAECRKKLSLIKL